AGTRGNTIDLVDLATGKKELRLVGHKDWVNHVAFSPDGRTLVSASKDRTLKQWDVKTGAELRTLAGHEGWVNAVAVSPDGRRRRGSCRARGRWGPGRRLARWGARSGPRRPRPRAMGRSPRLGVEARRSLSGICIRVTSFASSPGITTG